MNTRKGVRCVRCNSLERTRVIKLLLDQFDVPKPGMRVLHFAPERSLFQALIHGGQVEYDPVDFQPENFDFCKVRKIDLCTDAEKFPSEHYDV
ncbi:hypothetical protein OHD62_29710 [Mesorhizobium sp. YC-39]|uniref:hypothetical protein n=1 Tax=unclassified Mesorhizobium TaxID=325217 RepID=UPI0021E74883|nr:MULTISPECIES: hypothetical protein [unclassified Mesorhizobium]MCV3210530.1 hypothetical protein [Mesorhizobium sp. YC-2]MCV3232572.1 hypothetical protein [Mesorhizobium sp. YC-39]